MHICKTKKKHNARIRKINIMISKREEIQQILFWQNFDHKAKAGPFAIVDVMTAAIRQSGLARLDKGPAQHARPLESRAPPRPQLCLLYTS